MVQNVILKLYNHRLININWTKWKLKREKRKKMEATWENYMARAWIEIKFNFNRKNESFQIKQEDNKFPKPPSLIVAP